MGFGKDRADGLFFADGVPLTGAFSQAPFLYVGSLFFTGVAASPPTVGQVFICQRTRDLLLSYEDSFSS